MDGGLEISLDNLPVKRLEIIEENGDERFPSDVSYDERRVSSIRRVDFAWAVEREESKSNNKKQKKDKDKSTSSTANGTSSTPKEAPSSNQTWPWQSLSENLQSAHQELSVIIDLINTVEANDAVTVAGMTRPKQLPNELLSDLSVSSATKLQSYRHLGNYFKKSAKALDQQVAREARFYGALIRLQQNWKVKKNRMIATNTGNEGFYMDLVDNTLYDPAVSFRPSSISAILVEHDPAGMLAVNLPPKACHSLQFEFLGSRTVFNGKKSRSSFKDSSMESLNDDEYIKKTHSILREVHRSIFDEQVFALVNHEAFNPSLGVNVTGISENYLRLSIAEVASVSIKLVPSVQDDQGYDESSGTEIVSFVESISGEKHNLKELGFPNRVSFEIYLQQLFHEHVFVKAKNKPIPTTKNQISNQPKENLNLLGHFCISLAHRIFSNKVLFVLEHLVSKTPYVRLKSHPTWNSRTSSWSLLMEVPQSILHASTKSSKPVKDVKDGKSQFWTMVTVNDDCINVEGEGGPNIVGLFKGRSESLSSMIRYDCDLADLPAILLQQVANQVIRWLYEEACLVGLKANRDYLSLAFEVDQGETLALVAHVDPEDDQGCISWWLVMEDRFKDKQNSQVRISDGETENRRFLGHLSLDVLYSTLLDLVKLCNR